MNKLPEPEPKKNVRSNEFRYIPCDAVNLGLGDNGVKLIFGVEEFDGSTLELSGVHLSHRTAMFLKSALEQALDHYQKQSGIKLEEKNFTPEIRE